MRVALRLGIPMLREGKIEETLDLLCAAVLDAEPPSTRFVIGVREESGHTLIYGPFAKVESAMNVIAGWSLGTGEIAGIFPLYPKPGKGKDPVERPAAIELVSDWGCQWCGTPQREIDWQEFKKQVSESPISDRGWRGHNAGRGLRVVK